MWTNASFRCFALAVLPVLSASIRPLGAGEISVFEWEGSFEVGARAVQTGGNHAKYREHVNVRKGPRLFHLDVTGVVREGENGFFDTISVQAENLGGDPFETLGVTVKKFRKYNFRYSQSKAAYFYADTILPAALATPSLRDAGDLHTFDTDREFQRVDFDFRAAAIARVFFHFDRQSRRGESSTTRDLSRDEFELDQPIDEIKDDYRLGVELGLDRVTLVLEGSYREYERNGRLFLPGFSPGENPENATSLALFEQLAPFDFAMPQGSVRASIRPHDRVRLQAGYTRAVIDADLQSEELALGTSFQGLPLASRLTGRGNVDRTLDLLDIDADIAVSPHVDLLAGFAYRALGQDGRVTVNGERFDTDFEIDTFQIDTGARIAPRDEVSITAGARHEERDVTEAQGDARETTSRTTVFLAGALQPNRRIGVFGEVEHGSFDDPFTRVSPTGLDRVKLRLRARLTDRVNVVAAFLHRGVDNELTAARAATTTLSLQGAYRDENLGAWGRFSRSDGDREILNQVATVGFGGGSTFEFDSVYRAETAAFEGGVELEAAKHLAIGFETHVHSSRGSFGVDRQEHEIFGLFRSPSGYRLRLAYARHDYDEDDANLDEYDADIITFAVGYGFGR